LWLKTELLHPVDKGGRIRTYQMLRSLAREHEITYLCLDDGLAAADARQRASEYCTRLETIPFSPPGRGTVAFYADVLRSLASPLPYSIARYRSSAMRERIVVLASHADLVVCDFLTPAINVPDGLGARTVLFQHNVEAQIWERHAVVARNPVRRYFMREQWRRMRDLEAAQCRRFDHVVAVSESDANLLRSYYGLGAVSHVRTGVDLDYFRPMSSVERRLSEIVFVGSMDWMPNEDGIRWFAREVFPRVQQRVPVARLTIVGRKPSASLHELSVSNASIEVTGSVPDVRSYLARAAVSVVPLRVGGGTRLKIYEAMAMATPVVSTTIGAEGLPVRHGEHLCIADSVEEFAGAVVSALQEPSLAARLVEAALHHVRTCGSWGAVGREFLDHCFAAPRLA
jgi:sugar transferase (PEP-CTERM/EpsH1 system associated)